MTSKKLTIKTLAKLLRQKFPNPQFQPPDCYNHHPGTGYCVPGNSKWTRAILLSGIGGAHNFWSGSLPTPSTQIPDIVYNFLRSVDKPFRNSVRAGGLKDGLFRF